EACGSGAGGGGEGVATGFGVETWFSTRADSCPKRAIRLPRSSVPGAPGCPGAWPGAGDSPEGVTPVPGMAVPGAPAPGAAVPGRAVPGTAGELRPCNPILGSGALRTSGSSTLGSPRLALSTNGMGTWVTNRATATAAARPSRRPSTTPYSVTPRPLAVLEERRLVAMNRLHPLGR